jgi:aldehyde dehydrogenase (NAD+)
MTDAAAAAKEAAVATKPGDPFMKGTNIGPVASAEQFAKVQRLIKRGIEEGAELVVGGIGRPEGIRKGYFVKPTVFASVENEMTIAREENFRAGPFHHSLRRRRRCG